MILDEKDIKVLNALVENSKSRTSQLSKKLRMPITTVHNRIKKLEKEGIIKNYTIVPDYKKLNKGVLSYILVTVMYMLPNGEKISQENVAKKIKSIGAEEVSIVTGGTDIVVKVKVIKYHFIIRFIILKG